MQAALKGSEQIGFTIVSLTVSLIAVLIPLLFMGDIVGRLFREFAITLAVTILVSAVVSLTLTPMMCAKILRHKPEARAGLVLSQVRRCLQLGDRAVRRDSAMGPAAISASRSGYTVATLVVTILLYIIVPKGFFPVQDTGVILGISEAPADDFICRDGEAAAGAGARHPAGSGGGEPVVLHRRRRHQHDPEQRTDSDQSEAAGAKGCHAQRRHPAAAAEAQPKCTESRSTCNRCRTLPWKIA